jgi:hypothetical protein
MVLLAINPYTTPTPVNTASGTHTIVQPSIVSKAADIANRDGRLLNTKYINMGVKPILKHLTNYKNVFTK